MKTSDPSHDSPTQRSRTAIRELVNACKQGRTIVPFLAAGISVPTGFPSMAAITNYLAKTKFLISQYRDPYLQKDRGAYTPSAFLRRFGWPNYNRLNADVWRLVTGRDQLGADTVTSESHSFDYILAIYHSIYNSLRPQRPNSLQTKVLALAKQRWANKGLRLQQIVDAVHLETLSIHDMGLARKVLLETWVANKGRELYLRGDWYDLLMTITDGDFDLVDALFLSLGQSRQPGAVHTFLAQLVDLMGVQLYLTVNFDPFIELALRGEGHKPVVYDTFRDADLPSAMIIRTRLAVLKLHGGVYGVRIGERIQESLDVATRDRALEIIPEDALILVMGFSGYERRMMQLLEAAIRRGDKDHLSLVWMHWGDSPDLPVRQLVGRLTRDGLRQRILPERYRDAATFLFELLCVSKSSFPSCKTSYSALPTRAIVGAETLLELPKARIHLFTRPDLPDVIEHARLGMPTRGGTSDASVLMSRFCSALEAFQYQPIWVDCEEHHTTEGVVADILDRIIARDPTFPPLLMHTSDLDDDGPEDRASDDAGMTVRNTSDKDQIRRAVERIREALQRNRYILCIDSPEAFARPQTVHHGVSSLRTPGNATPDKRSLAKFVNRLRIFQEFLQLLLIDKPPVSSDTYPDATDVGESYIAMALDTPTARHRPTSRAQSATFIWALDFVKALFIVLSQEKARSPSAITWRTTSHTADGPPREINPIEPLRQSELVHLLRVLLEGGTLNLGSGRLLEVLLSCFRRPRSYLAFRSIFASGKFKTYIKLKRLSESIDVNQVDPTVWEKSFAPAEKGGTQYGERVMEGGMLWLTRQNHNLAFDLLAGTVLGDIDPETAENEDFVQSMSVRLLLLATLHRRISQWYFSDVYSASRDMDALREYIYHKIAQLRYMAQLSFIIIRLPGSWPVVVQTIGGSPIEQLILRSLGVPAQYPIEQGSPSRALAYARLVELRAFAATLSRESDSVLRTMHPATWLGWLDRILQDDCEWIIEDIRRLTVLGVEIPPEIQAINKEIDGLKRDLRNQEMLFRRESGDFGGAILSVAHSVFEAMLEFGRTRNGKSIFRLLFPPQAFSRFASTFEEIIVASDVKCKLLEFGEAFYTDEEGGHDIAAQVSSMHYETQDLPVAEVVTSVLSVTKIARDLTIAATLHHYLAVSPTRQAATLAKTLASISEAVISRLRAVVDALGSLPRLKVSSIDGELSIDAGGSKAGLLYSEQAISHLMREVQRGELERAFWVAVEGFQMVNLWMVPDEGWPRKRHIAKRLRMSFAARVLESDEHATFLDDAMNKANRLDEMVSQTSYEDRSVYNLFKARSLMLQSRANYLKGARYEASLGLLARADKLLDECGSSVAIDRIVVWRSRAECLMLESDDIISSVLSDPQLDERPGLWVEKWLAAEQKLLLARHSLMQALSCFEERKRNIAWWLRIARDFAQWSIEAALLNIVGLPIWTLRQERDRTLINKYDEILDHGLSSIRACLDAVRRSGYRQPIYGKLVASGARAELRRTIAQWLCLTGATFWVDYIHHVRVSTIKPDEARSIENSFEDIFWERWSAVNRVSRLPNLVGPTVWRSIRPSLPDNADLLKVFWGLFRKDLGPGRMAISWAEAHDNPVNWIIARQFAIDTMKELIYKGETIELICDTISVDVFPRASEGVQRADWLVREM